MKFAPFAREIHYTTDANTRHGRGFCRQLQSCCKMYSCFCKSTKMYIQLRVPTYNHNYFVLHCCFRFSASARNDVTARARSWLVNAARISAKVQIFQLARFARINSRYSREWHVKHSIAPQDSLSRLCIDLTCKSFVRNASFASGVNAPLCFWIARGTLMSYTDHSAQRGFKSNTPPVWLAPPTDSTALPV